ncbi:hypothetical protein E1B28_012984 [Marasmius oreades]|uniref:Uncharacterized protein n=1 Tax=Marasmius oreades TaxID=181124 RepID=A0A9P7UMH1_9AGAR|nr:uncharacterized protein E1B28_012984 [Marasmius oreades]KAG7087005.1 hypothetical protein E1B28_012984 [Marasmius oreades]
MSIYSSEHAKLSGKEQTKGFLQDLEVRKGSQAATPSLNETLHNTFSCIGFEWHDLDGLHWHRDPGFARGPEGHIHSGSKLGDSISRPEIKTGIKSYNRDERNHLKGPRDLAHSSGSASSSNRKSKKPHRMGRSASDLHIDTLHAVSRVTENRIPFPSYVEDKDDGEGRWVNINPSSSDEYGEIATPKPRPSVVGERWNEEETTDIEGLTEDDILELVKKIEREARMEEYESAKKEAMELSVKFEESYFGFQ